MTSEVSRSKQEISINKIGNLQLKTNKKNNFTWPEGQSELQVQQKAQPFQ
jgi:hypothetical protein